MKSKLEVRNLSYSYHTLEGETPALSRISFDVKDGEFLAIVGPSGCGKSTLLSLLCGLLKAEEGTIFIDGVPQFQSGQARHQRGHPDSATSDTLHAPDDSPYSGRQKSSIGYMLQRDHLFEWRTIFSNVALGLEIQNRLDDASKNNLRQMLDTYGLLQFQDSRPSQLSGGMRQRAALIRTMALEPDILLLDEPFSALDYQTRLEVCDDISTIIRTQGKTAILITHDLSEAISVADRILILTARPARVKNILEISFAPEFDRPLTRRNAPEFSAYFNQLWKELKSND